MNLHTAVQNWVDNDGVFGEGIAFLHGIGKSDVYARLAGYMLGHFVPESAKQELRHTLVAWAKEHTMSENPSEMLEVSSTKKATVTDSKSEPESIRLLREDAKRLHKQHAYLNSQLHTADSDEKRLSLAIEIMENTIPKLDDIYDQIRDFQESGIVPVVPLGNIVKETVEKMQRLQSIRSRISRLKKFLEGKMEAKKRQEYEVELLEKESEAIGIEKELGL